MVIAAPVLEKIEGLEFTENRLPVLDGNADLHLCQSRAKVGRHVVQSLLLMAVEPTSLWSQTHEEGFEVCLNLRVGIGLNE